MRFCNRSRAISCTSLSVSFVDVLLPMAVSKSLWVDGYGGQGEVVYWHRVRLPLQRSEESQLK